MLAQAVENIRRNKFARIMPLEVGNENLKKGKSK